MISIQGQRINENHISSYYADNLEVGSIKSYSIKITMNNGDLHPFSYTDIKERNKVLTNLDKFLNLSTCCD